MLYLDFLRQPHVWVFSPCPCVATESANTSRAYKHRHLTFRKHMTPFEDVILTVQQLLCWFRKTSVQCLRKHLFQFVFQGYYETIRKAGCYEHKHLRFGPLQQQGRPLLFILSRYNCDQVSSVYLLPQMVSLLCKVLFSCPCQYPSFSFGVLA